MAGSRWVRGRTADELADWLPAAAQAELDGLLGALIPAQAAGDPGALAGISARARELVEGQPLPAALADAVAAAHDRLEQRARAAAAAAAGVGSSDARPAAALRVAVRSSAVSEDGAGASFAGQYETYLGVSGIADVLGHIRKCWASGYSARALEYRRRLGGGGASARPHALDLAVRVLGAGGRGGVGGRGVHPRPGYRRQEHAGRGGQLGVRRVGSCPGRSPPTTGPSTGPPATS